MPLAVKTAAAPDQYLPVDVDDIPHQHHQADHTAASADRMPLVQFPASGRQDLPDDRETPLPLPLTVGMPDPNLWSAYRPTADSGYAHQRFLPRIDGYLVVPPHPPRRNEAVPVDPSDNHGQPHAYQCRSLTVGTDSSLAEFQRQLSARLHRGKPVGQSHMQVQHPDHEPDQPCR